MHARKSRCNLLQALPLVYLKIGLSAWQVLLGNWFEPLHDLKGQLSGVVCNPPYIASEIVPTLQVQCLSYILQFYHDFLHTNHSAVLSICICSCYELCGTWEGTSVTSK